MKTIVKKISGDDQRIALESISKLEVVSNKLKEGEAAGIRIKVGEKGELITIPQKAFSLLLTILSNMSEGRSIAVVPGDSEVTTQEAADILRVSRPHLVKLLERGKIPFRKVGSHRRILLKDVLAFERRLGQIREEQLKFLADQAQDLGLGYE
jgi:excisionase family DNA binding protein